MSERAKEALRRLRDPRPPIHWGEFDSFDALAAARNPDDWQFQRGDYAQVQGVVHVFTGAGRHRGWTTFADVDAEARKAAQWV